MGLRFIRLLVDTEVAACVCGHEVEPRPCRFVCLFTSRFQLPQFLRPVRYNTPWLAYLIEWANVCLAKRHGAYNNLGDGPVITDRTLLGLACLVSRTVGTGSNLSWKGYRSVCSYQRQLSWYLPCNDWVTAGIMLKGAGSCSLSSMCLLHYMAALSAHLT